MLCGSVYFARDARAATLEHLSTSSSELTERALSLLQTSGWVNEPTLNIEVFIRKEAKEWTAAA